MHCTSPEGRLAPFSTKSRPRINRAEEGGRPCAMSSAFGAVAGLPGSCPTIPTSVVSHSASARAAHELPSGLGDLALGRKASAATASISGGADRGRPHSAGGYLGQHHLTTPAHCAQTLDALYYEVTGSPARSSPAQPTRRRGRASKIHGFQKIALRSISPSSPSPHWPFPLPPPTTAQ